MKHKINNNYERYIQAFNKIAKKLKINTNTYKGQQEFGKVCNYYINKKIDKHKTNRLEHVRHTIFLITKILWIVILAIYLFFYFFPSENIESEFLKEMDERIETVLIIFTGIILCYFFFPIFPKPILSNTDYVITFSAGIILILTGIKHILTGIKHN